ncbi:MAG: carbohydrate ABC transporter permease [Lachnospiraceae bacterium]|nr:carbohydrate ABC transporter permease [Lachnospiraceae bacterium]
MSKEKKIKVKSNISFRERNSQTHGYLLQKKIGDIGYRVIRAVLLFGLCFLILQPLINKLSVSLMAEENLYDATVINIPRDWTLVNFKMVDELIDYWKCLFNSAWVSLVVAVLQVAAATLVGYGFARFNFPFKKFWFGCVILVIIVPPQTIMSPLYLNFRYFDIFGIFQATLKHSLNLQKTIVPYLMMCATCMGLKSGLYIFMLRQYFRGVPKELEEAAYVDGCGNLQTFIRIMLPDAKSMIVSCFLFAYVWQWTDSLYSKMFLGDMDMLPKGLNSISGSIDAFVRSTGYGTKASAGLLNQMISTGTLMAIFPLLILYLFAQKGFVESLSQTGIKM